MRPHRRQGAGLRPGGDLSIDISGPHVPGRWPSDAPEAQPRRAQYFLLAAFKSYDEEELEQRAKNEAFAARTDKNAHAVGDAAEVVGPGAAHGESEANADGAGNDSEEFDGRMLCYFRPLETKHLRETIQP